MIDLFKQIAEVHGRVTGWCPVDKAMVLASAVIFTRPSVVVEIGVWGGKSLIPMAMACQALGHGKVVAIDPWSPQVSIEGFNINDPQDQRNIAWWSTQDHEMVYLSFIQNLRDLGLTDIVDVRRTRSDDVTPPDGIGLLHVDGSHTEQAIRDVDRFAAMVMTGGLVFTDDDHWSSGGPKVALEHLSEMGFTVIGNLGTGSIWRR